MTRCQSTATQYQVLTHRAILAACASGVQRPTKRYLCDQCADVIDPDWRYGGLVQPATMVDAVVQCEGALDDDAK